MNMQIIGKKAKALRESANLTQQQVSDFLGVDQSLISKLENGERAINSSLAEQLCALYCCQIDELFNSEAAWSPRISFRTNRLEKEDLQTIAVINKIALNQFGMDELASRVQDER